MRRNTPGVLSPEEIVQARIARAEAENPAEVIARLEPLVEEKRRDRLKAVLGERLESVSVIFDAPYDPHNGAAVIRSAEAFGLQYVHVVERYKVRFLAAASVARGSHKWIDLISHEEPDSVIRFCRDREMKMVAADPDGELVPEDLRGIGRVAIVVGNERDGVREEMLQACDARVRVPMRGFVESLNVSVTAAILLQAATQGRPGDLTKKTFERMYARGLFFSLTRAEDILEALAE